MKKLICTKEVEEAEKQGQKVIYIDENTLVTPAAKDAAINAGIEFVCGQAPEACAAAPAAPAEPAPAAHRCKEALNEKTKKSKGRPQISAYRTRFVYSLFSRRTKVQHKISGSLRQISLS